MNTSKDSATQDSVSVPQPDTDTNNFSSLESAMTGDVAANSVDSGLQPINARKRQHERSRSKDRHKVLVEPKPKKKREDDGLSSHLCRIMAESTPFPMATPAPEAETSRKRIRELSHTVGQCEVPLSGLRTSEVFAGLIKKYDVRPFNVGGGGFCLFHAVFAGLFYVGENGFIKDGFKLLERLLEYLQSPERREEFCDSVEPLDYPDWLDRLAQGADDCDREVAVYALADMLNVNIIMLGDMCENVFRTKQGEAAARATIYLGNEYNRHFVALLPRSKQQLPSLGTAASDQEECETNVYQLNQSDMGRERESFVIGGREPLHNAGLEKPLKAITGQKYEPVSRKFLTDNYLALRTQAAEFNLKLLDVDANNNSLFNAVFAGLFCKTQYKQASGLVMKEKLVQHLKVRKDVREEIEKVEPQYDAWLRSLGRDQRTGVTAPDLVAIQALADWLQVYIKCFHGDARLPQPLTFTPVQGFHHCTVYIGYVESNDRFIAMLPEHQSPGPIDKSSERCSGGIVLEAEARKSLLRDLERQDEDEYMVVDENGSIIDLEGEQLKKLINKLRTVKTRRILKLRSVTDSLDTASVDVISRPMTQIVTPTTEQDSGVGETQVAPSGQQLGVDGIDSVDVGEADMASSPLVAQENITTWQSQSPSRQAKFRMEEDSGLGVVQELMDLNVPEAGSQDASTFDARMFINQDLMGEDIQALEQPQALDQEVMLSQQVDSPVTALSPRQLPQSTTEDVVADITPIDMERLLQAWNMEPSNNEEKNT